jgi:hypothetical protein
MGQRPARHDGGTVESPFPPERPRSLTRQSRNALKAGGLAIVLVGIAEGIGGGLDAHRRYRVSCERCLAHWGLRASDLDPATLPVIA